METLVEKIRIIEASGTRGRVNLDSLTNFPHVIMPPKFKAPEFVKYGGTEIFAPICACSVVRWHPMETITCSSARFSLIAWLALQPPGMWDWNSSWREVANAFLEYYLFNTKIAPNHTVLQRTKKKSRESFHEYAQRWCEIVAQVLPPMMENEMIKWFIDNLKPPNYKKVISAQVTHFVSLIPIGEHIVEGIRSKKIVDPEALIEQ